ATNAEDLAKQEKNKRKERQPTKSSAGADNPSAESTPPRASGADAQRGEQDSEHESDVRVVTRAIYRVDNEGYLDPKHPAHLWLVPAPHSSEQKVRPRQLTRGRFDEENAIWSRDGSQIYFTSNRVDEPYYELPSSISIQLRSPAASRLRSPQSISKRSVPTPACCRSVPTGGRWLLSPRTRNPSI